ncbi:RHS repeat-associated core domain-containing protein, partial [Chryseobacterium sp. YIM B02567]|nr:RHS repeat-associated core domain-containing protein [Chryseobacterium paridis]
DVNTAADVKKYVTVTSWASGTTASAISQSVNYAAGQLYKNTVTDEDGNKTIEFKNGKGQVVMVRKVINATDNADTYYVYNEYNQLAFVIPPKAAIVSDVNTVLGSLCYIYRYDGRNRLILKKLPGKDYEFMVYDKQDRLIMTQDAVMGASKQWLFTKYDQFGRVAYTGIYTSTQVSGTVGRAAEQALADAAGSNNVARTTSVGFTNSGMDVYYDNGTSNYPNNITKLLTVNYYDFYLVGDPFPTKVWDQDVLPSNPQQYGRSTKGLNVSSFVKNIEDDNWSKTYFYYDLKGRAVREFSFNHLGGYTNVERQLDFSGNAKIVFTQHKRLATDPEKRITENFGYDAQNRLLTHTHQIDNNPVE